MTEAQQRAELRRRLDEIWRERRPALLVRLAAVEAAADGVGTADRGHAVAEAHKLAGSLGSFGHAHASRLARRAEQLLTNDRSGDVALRAVVRELGDALRGDDRGP